MTFYSPWVGYQRNHNHTRVQSLFVRGFAENFHKDLKKQDALPLRGGGTSQMAVWGAGCFSMGGIVQFYDNFLVT